MITFLLVSAILLFAMFVTGQTVYRVFGLQPNSLISLTGLAFLTFLAQAMSVFLPLNFNSLLIILFILLLSFIRNYSKIYKGILQLIITDKIIFLLSAPFIILGFWICQEPPLNYDTGLYHFQNILWNENYPVIKGLANLHGRFGFNSSVLTVHSLFSFSSVFGQHLFVLNFCLFCVVTFYFIRHIIDKWTNDTGMSIANIIIFAGVLSLSDNLSSPTPDYPANVILMMLVASIMNTADWKKHLNVSVAIVSVYLITVKLSMLPVLVVLVPLLFFVFQESKYRFVLTFMFCVGITGIWFYRNFLLSGWLIYPFAGLDIFCVDWKVPYSTVIFESDAIKGWARFPGIDIQVSSKMPFLVWFPHWWTSASFGKLYFILCILNLLYFTFLVFKRKISFRLDVFWIGNMLFAGCLFWFFMAPDFRFSIGFLFLTIILFLYIRKPVFNFSKQNYFIYVTLTVFCILYAFLNKSVIKANAWPSQMSGRWKLPKTLHYAGRQRMDSFQLANQVFYYPYKSDSTLDFRCYDQCLPCVPSRDTNIGFRGRTIEEGFYRKRRL